MSMPNPEYMYATVIKSIRGKNVYYVDFTFFRAFLRQSSVLILKQVALTRNKGRGVFLYFINKMSHPILDV